MHKESFNLQNRIFDNLPNSKRDNSITARGVNNNSQKNQYQQPIGTDRYSDLSSLKQNNMSGIVMGKGESSRSGGSGEHMSILLKKSNGSYIEQNAGPSARSKNSAGMGGNSSNGMDTMRNPNKS